MRCCKISLNAFKRHLVEAPCVSFTKVQLLGLSHTISVCSEEIMFVDEPSYLQQLKKKDSEIILKNSQDHVIYKIKSEGQCKHIQI